MLRTVGFMMGMLNSIMTNTIKVNGYTSFARAVSYIVGNRSNKSCFFFKMVDRNREVYSYTLHYYLLWTELFFAQ